MAGITGYQDNLPIEGFCGELWVELRHCGRSTGYEVDCREKWQILINTVGYPKCKS